VIFLLDHQTKSCDLFVVSLNNQATRRKKRGDDVTWEDIHKQAFNVASTTPVVFQREARSLIDRLLETGAPWSEARAALSRLAARHSASLPEKRGHDGRS
jgi:hypothetical protein